jgi:hypothetical protein
MERITTCVGYSLGLKKKAWIAERAAAGQIMRFARNLAVRAVKRPFQWH